MNPDRFRRLDAYIRELPDGLESYPECQCKASVIRGALDQLQPNTLLSDELPDVLGGLIDELPHRNRWIPETLGVATYLAIMDQYFDGDEQGYFDWAYGVGDRVFQSPLYRVLMLVASPERLARGASRRWSAFHRGSAHSIEIEDWGSCSTIRYPNHLFPKVAMQATTAVVQAAYRASGARRATVEISSWSPTETTFRSVWHPPEH